MPVSVEMYIVISLMFAVFAAVAAIGTSLVLGVGFERLRSGFEIVKKQTGFFADAIHKLDERTKMYEEKTKAMKESVSDMSVRVERVEKQTGFFSNAIHSIEERILEGTPAQKPQGTVEITESVEQEKEKPVLAEGMDWSLTFEAARLLKEKQAAEESSKAVKKATPKGISSVFLNYLYSDNSSDHQKDVVYH